MDLPYTPKFFKKLELFQEIRRLNKREGEQIHWQAEKALLKWANAEHHHLGTPLLDWDIERRLEGMPDILAIQPDTNTHVLARVVIGNLISRGWAVEYLKERADGSFRMQGAKIAREGMLAAEVIGDVLPKQWKRVVYSVFGGLTWVIFGAALIALLFGAYNQVRDSRRPANPPTPVSVSLTPTSTKTVCTYPKKTGATTSETPKATAQPAGYTTQTPKTTGIKN